MACPYCGRNTHEDMGRLTLSINDELVIIEDVPARVCNGCMEQFFGEEILGRVERMRGKGLASSRPRKRIDVPVYSWEDLR